MRITKIGDLVTVRDLMQQGYQYQIAALMGADFSHTIGLIGRAKKKWVRAADLSVGDFFIKNGHFCNKCL